MRVDKSISPCPVCGLKPPRSSDQNKAQWPILSAWAEQKQWPVNGQMSYLTAEDWKDILTAAFHKENPRVANAYGSHGVVMLGKRTSKFSKERFSEWLEWLHAMSAMEGIVL